MAVMERRTMTLNLTDREMEALEELAGRKDLSKTQVVRQAIRLYQTVESRLESGEKLYFEDKDKTSKSELMML
jgi:predicted transcriptional regulator